MNNHGSDFTHLTLCFFGFRPNETVAKPNNVMNSPKQLNLKRVSQTKNFHLFAGVTIYIFVVCVYIFMCKT